MRDEITAKEMARQTGKTASRIRQLLAEGFLTGYKYEGSRDWWIPTSQIELIKNRKENRGRKKVLQ